MILIVSKKRLAELFKSWGLESFTNKRSNKEKVEDFAKPEYGELLAIEFIARLKRRW